MAVAVSYWIWLAATAMLGYILISLVRRYMEFRRNVAVLSKIPGPEPEFLFGNARQFPGLGEEGFAYFRDQMKIRPKIGVVWMGPAIAFVSPNHADTAKLILRTSEPKSRNIYGLVKSWLGEGLLVANGKKWARSRRLLTPAFHFDILKRYLVVKNRASDVFVDKLSKFAKDGSYFEAFSAVGLFSLDVILQSAFSYKSDCQTVGSSHPYIQAVTDLNDLIAERFFQFWLYNDFIYYLTPKGRKWKRSCDYVHSVAEKIIKERKQKLEEEKRQGEETKVRDFLGILLTARDDEGVGMTPLEIRNEVDTFLFEGHDTTTSGISWALYSIAKHPDVQQRVQQEIDEVLEGRDSDDILWEDLSKFPYMTMVIKESMRINPPVPFIQRVTTEPLTMEGYEIPVGTLINIMIYNLLNNHTVWDDPSDFRPERFLAENTETRDPFSYVPFSAGPRNCIGQNFAMHEMKVAIARTLRRFSLEVDPNHKVERKLTAITKSMNGIRIRPIPRKLKS